MCMLCMRFFGAGEFAAEFVRPSFFGKTQPRQHRHCQSNFCLDIQFLHTFRIFLHKNKPIRSYFALNDGG